MCNVRDDVGVAFRRAVAALIVLAAAVVTALANPAAPKARVEREFRQLEAALPRLIYNSVLPASDVAAMNRALYDFMRDNPGVVRILRTNAAGITVNDVSSESSESEPSRDVSAQRWFQHVNRNRTAYYSMDVDGMGSGDITLFYAWPLMTGADRSRYAGAFAAIIDFAAQVALIDDAAPFQLAYGGRVFFQHEWGDADYNEAALDIRGARGLTIRTEQPLPTRRDPVPAQRRARAEEEIIPNEYDNDSEPSTSTDLDAAGKREKGREKSGAAGFSTNTVIIIILISIIAAYIIFKYADPARRTSRFARDDKPQKPRSREAGVIARPSAPPQVELPPLLQEPPAPPPIELPPALQEPAPPPLQAPLPPIAPSPRMPETTRVTAVPPPLPPPPETPSPKVDVDAEKMGMMLKLIKEEFAMVDKKMQILALRISALEKRGG